MDIMDMIEILGFSLDLFCAGYNFGKNSKH